MCGGETLNDLMTKAACTTPKMMLRLDKLTPRSSGCSQQLSALGRLRKGE